MNSSKDGRPLPPPELSSIQTQIWHDVVASEPASYFESPANQALLVELCRHIQTAGYLASSIEMIEDGDRLEDVRDYAKLLALRESTTRCIASLATRLRLTNQSRYTPQAAATASRNTGANTSNPWDFQG